MKLETKILCCSIFLILLLFISPVAVEGKVLRVGVSPKILDAGTIERGESKIVTFYIITSSPDEFLVQLDATKGNTDLFNHEHKEKLINYSEEDASQWIQFLENPVVLRVGGDISAGSIQGSLPINFILTIPEDAEPGYHTVIIYPNPVSSSNYGGGTSIVAQIPLTLLFNVPGKALREGKILDITKGNNAHGKLELNIFFQNTGTVTISPRADTVEIFTSEGELVDTVGSNLDRAEPGEMVSLKAYVSLSGFDDEEYVVNAKASYLTGFAIKDASINILAPTPSPPSIILPVQEIPLWILVIPIIIIVAYLYYRRE